MLYKFATSKQLYILVFVYLSSLILISCKKDNLEEPSPIAISTRAHTIGFGVSSTGQIRGLFANFDYEGTGYDVNSTNVEDPYHNATATLDNVNIMSSNSIPLLDISNPRVLNFNNPNSPNRLTLTINEFGHVTTSPEVKKFNKIILSIDSETFFFVSFDLDTSAAYYVNKPEELQELVNRLASSLSDTDSNTTGNQPMPLQMYIIQ